MAWKLQRETGRINAVKNYSKNKGPNIFEKRVGGRVKPDVPRVSIVMPAYNGAAFISESIDSALAQTLDDFEIIVINDGSPDTEELEKILEPYFDRIIYISQENAGASAARNTGIENSRGGLIAFLDCDDVWLKEKLAVQVDFLERSGCDMAYCNAEYFGADYYRFGTFMEQSPSRGEVTPESLITGTCNVITSGTILKSEVLKKFGAFDLNAPRTEDFELWFRLAKNGIRIGYQQDVLLRYRVSLSGLSGDRVGRADRDIMALDVIYERNQLTGREELVWREQMELCRAQLSLEKGKSDLAGGNFSRAQDNFRDANKYYGKLNLSVIGWLLGISPKLALLLFRKVRPAEFESVAAAQLNGERR